MTFSNLKINRREVRDKYKLNLDIPKWNQRVRKFKFISEILQTLHKTKGIFGASAMPWMKLFETLVNGLSILDYCRWELRPRGWEGPGSGSEKKCRNHLFI